MKEDTIMILKQEDFKYPTKEEIIAIKQEVPMLSHFGFKAHPTLKLLLNDKLPDMEAHRIGNLHNWDICLANRFGKLRQTFDYTLVNFNRGISDNYQTESAETFVNTFLFEYYVEVFYYFYFSSLGIVAHILNEYFRLEIAVDKVAFNPNLLKKVTPLENILIQINNKLTQSRDIRNSFAHRFTPTQDDFKTITTKTNKGTKMEFYSGKKYSLEDTSVMLSVY